MAKSLQSSLSPNRLVTLPDVHHRPQQSSGIYLKPENMNPGIERPFSRSSNGKLSPNTRDTRYREYENPARDLMLDFETRPTADNFFQTRRLVLAYNGFKIHNKDVKHKVPTFRVRYNDSLENCNLCWRCKKPIKVKVARKAKPTRIAKSTKLTPNESLLEAQRKHIVESNGGFRSEEPVRKIQHIRSVGGVKLLGNRIKTVNNIPTVMYADIPCHFEYKPYRDLDGEKKYRYVYVDGTGRNLQPRKDGHTQYFAEVKSDGTEKRINSIPHTYRVQNSKCNCNR